MSKKIHWNTVSPLLKQSLEQLMRCDELADFRLVGGTSLSLQIGHRISIDIDMFTDAIYDSISFSKIEESLRLIFPLVYSFGIGPVSIGKCYTIGYSEEELIKLDLFYTDEYIQPVLLIDGIRMASIEEIIAMKIDIVQRIDRKKDFWDLHELMDNYQFDKMLSLHRQRYPYNHNEELIKANFINFSKADEEADPICLKGKHWELIKQDILKARA